MTKKKDSAGNAARQAAKALSAEIRKSQKENERLRKEARKAVDAELRARMRELEKAGLYAPKGKTLTKHRRSEISKRYKQFGELLDTDKFVRVRVTGDRKKHKAVKRQATEAGYAASDKFVFVPRDPDFNKASVKFNKSLGKYVIEKRGVAPDGKLISKSETLLGQAGDVLTREARLRAYIDKAYARQPDRSFRIRTLGVKMPSRNSYDDADLLFRDIMKYSGKDLGGNWTFDDFIDQLELVWTDAYMRPKELRNLLSAAESKIATKVTPKKNAYRMLPNGRSVPIFKGKSTNGGK